MGKGRGGCRIQGQKGSRGLDCTDPDTDHGEDFGFDSEQDGSYCRALSRG